MSAEFPLAVVLCGLFAAGGVGFGQEGPRSTFTNSSAQVDVIHDTPIAQQVNTYNLELRARLQGGGLLADRFFNVPLNDPAVQDAIQKATGVLAAAGAVSFTGPALLSGVQSLVSSTSVTVQNSRQFSQHLTGTAAYFGPQTILLGDGASYQSSTTHCHSFTLGRPPTALFVRGQYATFSDCTAPLIPFVIEGGTENFDTSDLGVFDVFQTTTTTNTYLFTQVYEIDGIAPPVPDNSLDAFQLRYASHLEAGDSIVNLTNTGTLVLPGGLTSTGNLCANVYTFDAAEEMISCCACLVTPNGLNSLSARNDLINNTLTPGAPTSVMIKLLATTPLDLSPVGSGGTCDPSSPTAVAAGPGIAGSLVPGLLAWGTTIHALPTSPATYGVTESRFEPSDLSAAELTKLTGFCGFIQANGSGFGICGSCRTGGLGAARK